MRSLLLIGFVMSTALAACGGAPSAPSAPPEPAEESVQSVEAGDYDPGAALPPDMWPLPMTSLAGCQLAHFAPGERSEVVLEILLTPETIEADGQVMAATGTSVETWHYPAQGVIVTLARTDETLARVTSISVSAPWDAPMRCGPHLGMSEEDAVRVLGDDAHFVDELTRETLSATVEDGMVTRLVFSQMGE